MKLSTTSLLSFALLVGTNEAFAPSCSAFAGGPFATTAQSKTSIFESDSEGDALLPTKEEAPPFYEKYVEAAKFRYGLFQKAQGEGYDFKQATACALAGDYDQAAVKAKVEELIQSAPCVMFTWESSPSCKKAIEAFDKVGGVNVKIVRMDDPWDEGNPMRAEIGKMVGKSSVPMIFVGGEYVGGYDAGVSDDAPGILDMAFKGTLRPKLEAAGAMEAVKEPVAVEA
ncbi:unnamed protein product [Cylindrotheca closterium]|uniref:Glutaredoxin domain-containing protein n=1 Tax=Cylindrotheca closterium TaxID=2856 RepID=A0AAD2FKI4_9STRA|nr:unnamed protein product [Cylindrotheca closterium]